MKSAAALRVLIIDDAAEDAGGLKISLELKGHEARVASSTQEALSFFCGFEPQIVLVDPAALPGQCAALIEKLHEFPRYGKLTLIAAKAADAPLDIDHDAFDCVIDKPIQLDALLELLTTLARPDRPRKLKFSRPR